MYTQNSTPGRQNAKLKTHYYGVRYFRLLLWLAFFAIATFCWIVIIEHGPENIIEGTKIEIENLGWLPAGVLKKATPDETMNPADQDASHRRSAR